MGQNGGSFLRADPGWVLTPVLFYSLKTKTKTDSIFGRVSCIAPCYKKRNGDTLFYSDDTALYFFWKRNGLYTQQSLLVNYGQKRATDQNYYLGIVPCYSQVHKWGDNHIVQNLIPQICCTKSLCGYCKSLFCCKVGINVLSGPWALLLHLGELC